MRYNIATNNEKIVLSQLYDNTADTVKFLPFFFQNPQELKRFFNQFGGKTLVLPETFEEFCQYLLRNTTTPDDDKRIGIDDGIHDKTKERILNTYFNLFNSLQDVIENECYGGGKKK